MQDDVLQLLSAWQRYAYGSSLHPKSEFGRRDTDHDVRNWNSFIIQCHKHNPDTSDACSELERFLAMKGWPSANVEERVNIFRFQLELLAQYDS